MKFGKLIIICCLINSCSANEFIDNQKMKDSIDALEISKVVTEVATDSIGNILDTLSIEYLKYDKNNRKRFKKKVYWYKNAKLSWIDYFNSDESLFYRESFSEKGELKSIFETKLNTYGRVEKARQIVKEIESYDTLFMNYSYELYPNGKVKKLLIETLSEEIDEVCSEIEYDEYEKPLFELLMMKNDTLSFQVWKYIDATLQKSIYTNYQEDTIKSIYYFGEKELLLKEEKFEFKDRIFVKSKEIAHFYNEAKNREKSIERNLETSEIKYIKHITEKLNITPNK